jgi:hypothetical protein
LAIEQKFTCFEFLENARVRAATSEFSDFASVWWVEYGKKYPNDIPQTWITLKRVMRARFVPSYYAHDLINKLQQLKQGAKCVLRDFDEDTLALHVADLAGNDDHPEEHIGTSDADHYESLIVQRVLSTQMERVEQNEQHTLFQTKCVIKEQSCCKIVDGGSCNNLASSDIVDKLALTTKLHPCPYRI